MVFDIFSWLVFQLQGHNASAVLPHRSSDSVSQHRNSSLLVICSAVVVIRTSFCYVEMNSCRKDIHHRVQVSLALFKFESRGSNPLMKHQKKNLVYKCPNAKQVIKRQCCK